MDLPENKSRSRRRRRKASYKNIDFTIPAPCIRVCRPDNTTGYCAGCYRTMDEIRDWMIASREEKLLILENIEVRKGIKPGSEKEEEKEAG